MSVKYQKLQMEEKIDFSSPFSYENRNLEKKYRSIFRYNDEQDSNFVKLQFGKYSLMLKI